MIKGVYFDFGGVIGFPRPHLERKYFYLNWDGIDTLLADEALAARLRAGIGQKELEDFFQQELYDVFVAHEQTDLIDPQTGHLLRQRLPLIFVGPITAELVDRILQHLNTMNYVDIDPRATGLLQQLRARGLGLSMISNMMLPGQLLMTKLRENALIEYFDTITISSEIGFIKPHREIFLRTLAADGLKPDEVLFVGDTYHQDIIGAKRVDMKSVWLNTRGEANEIARSQPADYEIRDLRELLEKLTHLMQSVGSSAL